MKISNVNVELSDKDLLGIIKEVLDEFVEIQGLSIRNISMNEVITVNGTFKKGITIPFQAVVKIEGVNNNVINVKINKIKVLKIGILKKITNFILKLALKDFAGIGLIAKKESLYIDFNKLSAVIPYVDFEIRHINMIHGGLKVEVNNLNYSQNKEAETLESILKKSLDKDNYTDNLKNGNNVALIELQGDQSNMDDEDIKCEKNDDLYTKVRHDIEEKIPKKYKTAAEYALLIPDIIALLYRLFKDKRVNIKTKLIVGGILAYVISPIDILPENIPFLGKIDDIAIAFFGLNKIINEVPKEVVIENWEGDDDIIVIIREGVSFISNAVGGKNIEKIINVIEGGLKNKAKFNGTNKDM